MLLKLLDLESWKESHLHTKNYDHDFLLHTNQQNQQLFTDLGFSSDQIRLYPNSYFDDGKLPVFVSIISKGRMKEFTEFLFTFRKFYRDRRLVVYNIGISEAEKHMFSESCHCQIRDVRWSRFPDHIQNVHNHAYRPLIIQEALQEFGAIFWCDPSIRFNSFQLHIVAQQAQRVGLVSWPIEHPTSTLTHYKMFQYFNASNEDYFFHRMVQPGMMIIYNTKEVHEKLMYPWIRCALNYDCLAPHGSQPRGCNFAHKPKFIYAGCHRYDMSAMNIILGQMFQFELPYIAAVDIFHVQESKEKWFNFGVWNWTASL